jgi:MoaA/NifB/PqqE/SkfB family radical SAM enzyme
MAFVDLIPLQAYKRLENRAGLLRPVLEPVKKMTGGLAPFPWAVIAHITYRCNLDCTMCCQHIPEYASGLPGFPIPGQKSQEIPTQRWKEILDDLAESFPIKPFFHFGGGEPTLYPGFLELVTHAKSRGYNVSMITNAWLLQNHAEKLVDLGIDRINVSIDGSEDVHDEVRRLKGSYRRAIAGIRAVRAAREKAGKKTPHVTINCTITRENHARLPDMLGVLEESGADHLTYQHLVFLDDERELAAGIDVERILADLGKIERERDDVTIYPNVPKADWKLFYEGKSTELGNGCGWNWVGLRLHPNGEVAPCRNQVVGSLAEPGTSIKTIWNGGVYRKLRAELAQVGNYEDCGRCTHRLF